MKALEILAGSVIAVASMLILLVGSVFALGSLGKLIKSKSM